MYNYTLSQWLSFFFIYCFFGWVWESGYVSFTHKKWTNRGFMKGPLLPIYGSGAMIILFATLPLKDNLVLVFFSGMIAATLLEYITGATMEYLFKVRYWDYSQRFLNVNGHICLKCSLLWGFFSVILIRFGHVPVEKMVLKVPENILQIIVVVTVGLVGADFATSFKTAIDFKNLLMSLEINTEELDRLKKRMDVTIAFAKDDLQDTKDRVNAKLDELNLQRHLLKMEFESQMRYVKLLGRHPSARSVKFEDAFRIIKDNIARRMN